MTGFACYPSEAAAIDAAVHVVDVFGQIVAARRSRWPDVLKLDPTVAVEDMLETFVLRMAGVPASLERPQLAARVRETVQARPWWQALTSREALVETPELLTVQQVAKYFRKSPDTVYRWIKAGQLQAVQAGRGKKVTKRAVAAFIHAHPACKPEEAR